MLDELDEIAYTTLIENDDIATLKTRLAEDLKRCNPESLKKLLGVAIHVGDLTAVQTILGITGDVNQCFETAESPLAKLHDGLTPLTLAARSGAIDIVDFLLNKDADVNQRGWDLTPLMTAAFFGHMPIVKLLVQHNANIHLRVRSLTAAGASRSGGHDEITSYLVDLGDTSADRLFTLIKTLGYKPFPGGSCTGFAHLFMPHCLDETLDKFRETLTELSKISLDELKRIAGPIDTPHKALTEEELEKRNVILSTFDGLDVYQNLNDLMSDQEPPYNNDEMKVNQDPEQAFQILIPAKLEEKQKTFGEIGVIKHLLNAYPNKKGYSFIDYLKSAKECLFEPCENPIALMLHTIDHMIFITYDRKKKIWLLGDLTDPFGIPTFKNDERGNSTTQTPIPTFETEEELASQIAGLDDEHSYIFTTKIWGFINDSLWEATNNFEAALTKQREDYLMDPDNKKAYVNSKDSDGATELMLACRSGFINRVIELVSMGAEVDAIRRWGELEASSLRLAIQHGYLDIVKYLLEKGANPNLVLSDSEEREASPLRIAIEHGDPDIVEHLLQKGANPNLTLRDPGNEFIPLLAAFKKGNLDKKTIDRSHTNIALSLIQRGADVKTKSPPGVTPLYFAVFYNSLELAQAMLEKGAKINEVFVHNMTPLSLATVNKNLEMVCLLLEHGADIELALQHVIFGEIAIVLDALLKTKSEQEQADFFNNLRPIQRKQIIPHFEKLPDSKNTSVPVLMKAIENFEQQQKTRHQTPISVFFASSYKWKKLNEEILIDNRHQSTEAQEAYDRRFGLVSLFQ